MSSNIYYIIAAAIGILGFVGTVFSGIATLAVLMFRTGKLVSRTEENQKSLSEHVSKLESTFTKFGEYVEKAFAKLEEHSERLAVLETKSENTKDNIADIKTKKTRK